jgi:hypothetical protein
MKLALVILGFCGVIMAVAGLTLSILYVPVPARGLAIIFVAGGMISIILTLANVED